MKYTLVIIGIAGLLSVACVEKKIEEDFGAFAGIENIDVDVESADVEVISVADGIPGKVEMTLYYRGDTPHYEVQMTNTTLTVRLDCDWSCHGHFKLFVPMGVDSEIDTGSGNISLAGTEGIVYGETGSGNISLSNVMGDLYLDTGSGNIKGQRLISTVGVFDTNSGNVSLDYAQPPENVKVDTGSGNITVDVPMERYQIHTDTGSGKISVEDVIHDSGALNRISLETNSGNITLFGN